MFPRHFIQTAPITTQAREALRVVDAFVWQRGDVRSEVVVTSDEAGTLDITWDRGSLAPALREQLVFAELAGSRPRLVEAHTLWLVNATLVQHLLDVPGRNDPVLVHSELYGPLAPKRAVEGHPGHLYVRRADLLAGFVQSSAHAFRSMGAAAARWFHLSLPVEEASGGTGVVIAYPTTGPESRALGSNEGATAHLVREVLAALRTDIAIEEATRGLLARIFTEAVADQLEPPHEATIDELVHVATAALQHVDEWSRSPEPTAVETTTPTQRVRVMLPLTSRSAFVEQYRRHVDGLTVEVFVADTQPVGMTLDFQVLLADGTCVVRGRGVVASVRPTQAADVFAMRVALSTVDEASRLTLEEMNGR